MSRFTRFLPGVLLAGALIAAVIVITSNGDTYTVNARFKDAGGILKNYGVKIGGVPAGKVTKISLLPDDTVNVQMKLQKDAGAIGSGASAQIRPVNLLGEKYVDLNPGNLRQPQPSGSVIPESRTAVPVEIDDVLNILDPDTRSALRLLINESGVALSGRGTNFNKTLTDLPPALDVARKVVGQVAAENQNLETLITKGNKVLYSMAARRDDMGALVGSAAKALQNAADRREQLGQTVGDAPAALSHLRTTLASLQSASEDLAPAAGDLRKATPALASTLQKLPKFADDANGALAEARTVAPSLNRLGLESTPTLRQLRPTSERLAQYASDSDPMVKGMGGGTLHSLLDFADSWAHVTDSQDGLSHVFRLRLSFNKDVITSALARYAKTLGLGTKQRQKAKAPALKLPVAAPAPAAAKPEAQKPKLLQQPLGDTIKQTVAGVTQTVTGVLDGVTGALTGGKSRSGGDDATKLLNYLLAP